MIGSAIHLASGTHENGANLLGGFLLLLCVAAYVAAFTLVLVKVADSRNVNAQTEEN